MVDTAGMAMNELSKHPFQDANVINALASGVSDTLLQMCQMTCEFEKPYIERSWIPIGDGTGVLELKSGHHHGVLHIHFPQDVIITIINKMLGELPTELNDEVIACLGEITNIVYGTMKAKLNPLGYEFKMTIPKAEFTKNLGKPALPSARHLIIPFQTHKQKCFLEIIL
jgi:chemotaxis protein CheX